MTIPTFPRFPSQIYIFLSFYEWKVTKVPVCSEQDNAGSDHQVTDLNMTDLSIQLPNLEALWQTVTVSKLPSMHELIVRK